MGARNNKIYFLQKTRKYPNINLLSSKSKIILSVRGLTNVLVLICVVIVKHSDQGRNPKCRFCRIFTVFFLLFLAPAGSSNPAGPIF